MLDEEPEVTPKWRDQYVNAEILLLRGEKWPEAEWYAGNMIPMVTQFIDPIRTQSWTHINMMWNYQGEK